MKWIFCTLLFLTILAPSSSWALTIKGVRFGVHPGKVRIVLDLDQKTDFHVSVLPDPSRIVVDMPTAQWKAGKIKGDAITTIRQETLSSGKTRVTFGLRRSATILSAQLLPPEPHAPYRIVIDFASATKTRAAIPTPKKPVIVIDPGHGGKDSGAISVTGLFEKNVNLTIARALKRQLESSGRYEVYLTRNGDTYLKLAERVAYARRHKADLFISLHADSVGQAITRGASVYTLSDQASDEQTEKLAEQENRSDLIAGVDLTHQDKMVVDILLDLAMRSTMNQSNTFAAIIVNSLRAQGIRTLEHSHRSAGFAVLKAPDVPSTLLEAGFLSNTSDAQLLLSADFQAKLAAGVVAGIDAYFIGLK